MGKFTISMAIFNSYFDITRGYPLQTSSGSTAVPNPASCPRNSMRRTWNASPSAVPAVPARAAASSASDSRVEGRCAWRCDGAMGIGSADVWCLAEMETILIPHEDKIRFWICRPSEWHNFWGTFLVMFGVLKRVAIQPWNHCLFYPNEPKS